MPIDFNFSPVVKGSSDLQLVINVRIRFCSPLFRSGRRAHKVQTRDSPQRIAEYTDRHSQQGVLHLDQARSRLQGIQ